MTFSENEKHLLIAVKELERRKKLPSLEAIGDFEKWEKWSEDEQTLVTTLDQLIKRELMSRTSDAYSLTNQGLALAKQFDSQKYGAWMIASEQSQTNRKLCQRVYGSDRCQFNMMTQRQLDKLLEVLNLSGDDSVLDLGCGIGSITEHIADVTGARMTGIDFSAEAIQRAQERTERKRDRLSFQTMDMDELHFPVGSFDAIIAVDTFYFVADLNRTLHTIRECLRDEGQLGVFYSARISTEQPKENLTPKGTPLAKALQECGLPFHDWDFSQDEKEFWEKSEQTAEGLKQEFEAEGNLDIYESWVSEAKFMLEYCNAGRISRYLYHVQR